MFEAIYQGMDPRLANLDAATFRSLYDQYNGALQMWGQDAANAVFQQQLAGLPQSPVGAGATGGPRSGRKDFTQANTGAGTGATPVRTKTVDQGFGRVADFRQPAQSNVGAGATGGPQSRGGATNLGDIASAAMGGVAANIAPNNVGAGSSAGPAGRGGAIPQPVNVGAGATAGPSTRGGAIPQPVNVGAGATGGPSTRGGAIPQPVNVGAGATAGPSTRGGAIPQPVNVGAGATAGPSTRGGAIPQPVNVGAGATAGPSTRGGAAAPVQSNVGAGATGGPSTRGGAAAPVAAPAPVTTTPAHLGGRHDFTQERGFTPVTTPATPAATDLTTFDEGDQYPAAPTEAAVLDWLGTEGAANLLGTGGGGGQAQTPIQALPIGDAVSWVDPNAGGGGGVPPAGGGGGGSAGGGATAEAPIYYSEGGMSGYDLQATLADIERQMGRVDEQKLMQTSDLNRAMEQAQRALPGQFNRRGMLNSGLYNRGEGRLAEAGQRQRGRAEYGFGESYDALSRAAASAEGGASQAAIRNTMTDAERQASMASNIRDLGVY